VIAHRRDSAPVHVDGIGVGSSPVDLLREANVQVISVNVGEKSAYHGKAGNLFFFNLRSAKKRLGKASCRCLVNGEVVSEGQLLFGLVDK
jgi:hypothetical protein